MLERQFPLTFNALKQDRNQMNGSFLKKLGELAEDIGLSLPALSDKNEDYALNKVENRLFSLIHL